jgi:hypothetical protein
MGQRDDVVRRVVAYELLSLDGVAEEPDELVTDFDDAMRENLGRVIATPGSRVPRAPNLRRLGPVLANQ